MFPAKEHDPNDERLLASLLAVPQVSQVWAKAVAADVTSVQVTLTQKDVANNKNLRVTRTLTLGPGTATARGLATPLPDHALLSHSPSGRRSVLVQAGGGPGKDGVFEIWAGARKLHDVVVPAATHGPLFADGFFGFGVAWSPCERYVAYAAQRPTKSVDKAEKQTGGADGSSAAVNGKDLKKPVSVDSVYTEDWGELNTKAGPPSVFILDTLACKVAAVPGQVEDVSYGQPSWAPNGGLVMVGWPHEDDVFPNLKKRLGIVYCFNRSCTIFYSANPIPPGWAAADRGAAAGADASDKPATPSADVDKAMDSRPLGADGGAADPVSTAEARLERVLAPAVQKSSMEPRFSPDGTKLVWVSYDSACETGTHYAGATLHVTAWDAAKVAAGGVEADAVQQVVGLVRRPGTLDMFPGLYSQNLSATLLPQHPFLDDNTVVMNTLWGFDHAVIAVHLPSGIVTRLSECRESFTFATHAGSTVFAVRTLLTALPSVVVADVPAILAAAAEQGQAGHPAVDWRALEGVLDQDDVDVSVTNLLRQIQPEMMDVQGDGEDSSGRTDLTGDIPIISTLFYSNPRVPTGQPAPSVLFLHGGPHSAATHAFVPGLLLLLAAGYVVVLPNYRGSAGQGEDHLRALPGHVGEMDVNDCMLTVDTLISRGVIDPERLAVVGGSHGGFLTGHLLGQHPTRFKCGALRNPVLDVSLMVNLTDIPDWCFVETLGVGEAARAAATFPVPEATLQLMRKSSPIAHVHRVKSPVLMFLGAKDRRVPHADGLIYATALRCQETPVRVHLYDEDTHALDRAQTAFDQWLTILAFLKMHLSTSPTPAKPTST